MRVWRVWCTHLRLVRAGVLAARLLPRSIWDSPWPGLACCGLAGSTLMRALRLLLTGAQVWQWPLPISLQLLGRFRGCWIVRRCPSQLGLCSGLVAGLVAISPAAGFVTPRSTLVIGLVAGVACYWGATSLKRGLKTDDSLDVFGVRGTGGIVGSLLTGVFAGKAIQVLSQVYGCKRSGWFGCALKPFHDGSGLVGDVFYGQYPDE